MQRMAEFLLRILNFILKGVGGGGGGARGVVGGGGGGCEFSPLLAVGAYLLQSYQRNQRENSQH